MKERKGLGIGILSEAMGKAARYWTVEDSNEDSAQQE